VLGSAVVVQFDSRRQCGRGRSLVPLEKTRDFGMTPSSRSGPEI